MQLSRVKDEFLFTIESTGILSPEELFKEALKVLAVPLVSLFITTANPFLLFQVLMEKCATVAAVLQGGAGE